MSTGVTVNCSMVEQDGDYKIGFHYNDSKGIDIDRTVEGKDLNAMLDNLIDDIVESLAEQQKPKKAPQQKEKDEYTLQLEKIIKDLTYENNSLKTDLNILQKRADDATNQNNEKSTKKHNDDYFDYLFYNLMDKEDWRDSVARKIFPIFF